MNLEIELKEKTTIPDLKKLDFGKNFSDHMFTMRYSPDKGWHDAKIEPHHNLELSPATMTFHYAQSGFEGMKAYKYKSSNIALMRPKENFKRLNRTAERLVMPKIDEEFVLNSLLKLLEIEKKWIPSEEGTALYIRPTLMGIDPIIKLRTSSEYLFFIILSPVGAYYKNGLNPIDIYVEEKYIRSAIGGTGDVKASANYGVSLIAGKRAVEKGYSQALWLDAAKHEYVEEVGSMNIFFVENGNKLLTPRLNGSILPGITRDSIIKLSKHLGYEVEEKLISIKDIVEKIEKGIITECFGTGTAVVISPVGLLAYQGKDYVINNHKVGKVTQDLYDNYVGIQYGKKEDIFNWLTVIEA